METGWLLTAGFGVILALIASVLAIAYQNLRTEVARLEEGAIALEKNRQAFNMLKTTFPGIYHIARTPQLDDYFDVDSALQEFNAGSRDFVVARDIIRDMGVDPEEREMFDALDKAVAKARPVIHDFFRHAGDTVEQVDDPQRRIAMVAELNGIYGPYHDIIGVLDRLTRQQIDNHQEGLRAFRADFDRTLVRVAAVGAAIVLAGIAIALYVIWREGQYRRALLQEVYERRRAEARAEESSRAKSEFLANMSHELRTPLNAVLGFAEMIRSEPFGPVGNERYTGYADDIHRSGRHLLDLINDILDLSAVEAGKLNLDEQDVAVAGMLDECLSFVRPAAGRGGVTLNILQADPVRETVLKADARRLRQMLINLLSNAVKFTPRGGTVSIATGRDPGGDFAISIADTGIGMTPDDVETALAPFGVVRTVYDGSYEGTGLGVPLTRRLIQAHGGRLEFETEKSEGTTVSLVFPATRVVTGFP